MTKSDTIPSCDVSSGLILNPIQLAGDKQMEIDLFLLQKIISESKFSIIIRFYTWIGDWLSIGKNQKNIPEMWLSLSKLKRLKIIRRPSGGKAVLHSGGLTYALIWRYPPTRKKESYSKSTKWLIDGFEELGVNLVFGTESMISSSQNCFATSSSADLIDKQGHKRVGSAQYWSKGNLLQHGEIIINPPKDLWVEIFDTTPPPPLNIPISIESLQDLLTKSIIKNWSNIKWDYDSLDNII